MFVYKFETLFTADLIRFQSCPALAEPQIQTPGLCWRWSQRRPVLRAFNGRLIVNHKPSHGSRRESLNIWSDLTESPLEGTAAEVRSMWIWVTVRSYLANTLKSISIHIISIWYATERMAFSSMESFSARERLLYSSRERKSIPYILPFNTVLVYHSTHDTIYCHFVISFIISFVCVVIVVTFETLNDRSFHCFVYLFILLFVFMLCRLQTCVRE